MRNGPHMRMPTVMSAQQHFSMVPRAQIERSTFDRSHGYKTTFDAGGLYPFFVDEALPGDTFNYQLNAFARLATPFKPIMDNMYLETFFFSVPVRLVWDNWQKFHGEQANPGDSTSFTVPVFSPHIPAAFSLSDYMGLPCAPGLAANIQYISLYHRAYALIWNEWFRDQNLQSSAVVDKGNGPDTITNYPIKSRGKRHDYFTSCLPSPQKGAAVALPLGTSAPVIPEVVGGSRPSWRNAGNTVQAGELQAGTTADAPGVIVTSPVGSWTANEVLIWQSTGLKADLSTATAASINQLRQAFQVQRLLERDARGGTRYIEMIKAHFGVTSPDARLQRPEYLGGGSTPVNVSPVAQTSAQSAAGVTTPQANLSGIGTVSFTGGHSFTKSFTEHCLVIGLMNVRADLTYQQGLPREFSRSTRFDYFYPALAHIGEQAVLNKELYCDGSANDVLTFGFQERYAEYRYKPSRITGQFRSTATAPLDVWHLSEKFTALPTLNSTFITDAPPVDRVIVVPTEPHFILDSYARYICARPMPVYGVPGFIDHF